MTSKTIAYKYDGITQAEARKELTKVTARIKRAVEAIASKEIVVGRELNTAADDGLAEAAANDIGDRDFTDGRETAVSRYIDTKLDGLFTKQQASAWRKLARQHDALEEAGVDVSKVGKWTFEAMQSDADMATFVDVVAGLVDGDDKVTATAFKDAGKLEGIVAKGNVGGGGDKFRKSVNSFLAEAAKAGDRKLSKQDVTQLEAVRDIAIALLG